MVLEGYVVLCNIHLSDTKIVLLAGENTGFLSISMPSEVEKIGVMVVCWTQRNFRNRGFS